MGCSNGKMVKVEPGVNTVNKPDCQLEENKNNVEEIKNGTVQTPIKRGISAKSQRSNDSGLGEGDNDSLNSVSTTTTSRTRSGGLKRTLRSLSARSNSIGPREDENDILQKLRFEGLLTSQTQTSKSGISFEVIQENPVPKRTLPARLAKLEKRQKRRKLLTQQDIEAKLKKAEERRKEVEAERLEKIQSVTKKSDITNALDNFIEHQKHVAEHVQEKVDSATENRAKKFKEMRDKLRAKEAHATQVRLRKQTIRMDDEGKEQENSSSKAEE